MFFWVLLSCSFKLYVFCITLWESCANNGSNLSTRVSILFFSFCLFQLCFLFANVITFYAIIVPFFSSIFVVLLLLLFYSSLLWFPLREGGGTFTCFLTIFFATLFSTLSCGHFLPFIRFFASFLLLLTILTLVVLPLILSVCYSLNSICCFHQTSQVHILFLQSVHVICYSLNSLLLLLLFFFLISYIVFQLVLIVTLKESSYLSYKSNYREGREPR